MQLEQRKDLSSERWCITAGAEEAQKSVSGLTVEGTISITERQLTPHIQAFLERVDFAKLDNIRLAGSGETVCQGIFRRLKGETAIPSTLARWLCDDIGALIRMFSRLTGAQTFLVRLEAISNDGCSRFHADNMRYRLVTTYSGPGTQWVAPPYAPGIDAEISSSPEMIRQLGTGWIALMRGRKAETAAIPAVLHRSPPMTGIEQPRLFLAIDDLADHSLVIADNL